MTITMKTMKASVLQRCGEPLVYKDVPVPEIGPGEVLVKNQFCGICGTDLHIVEGWGYIPKLPFIQGHEPCGIVEAVGEDVSDFKPGDRVVTNNFYTCGKCFYCRTNRETQCINLDGILGVLKHHGGFAQYFKIPARQLFHLPESIPFTEGAIISDAVVTCVHAAQQARLAPGEYVHIVSVGGMGGALIQICKKYGAKVIVTVRSDQKKERAEQLGADYAININTHDAAQEIKAITSIGVACAFDCVGNNDTMTLSMDTLSNGGRLVVVGYSQQKYALDPRRIAVHELEIIGSRCGGRQCTYEAIDFVADPTWKPLVTDIFDLEDANDALECLRQGKTLGRIVLKIDQ